MIDKRALKQQYLETRTRAGVYVIRNKVKGRALVAGSNNAQARLNRHRFELRYGSHPNVRLSKDFAETGESGFDFEVLDLVKHSDDPGFDAKLELEGLVALWREEIPCQGEQGYDEGGKLA